MNPIRTSLFTLTESSSSVVPLSFCVPSPQGAAIPNLALVWPQRFTWHSDFQVRSGFTHNEKDFLYVLRQREEPTPNSPNTYTVYMNYERYVPGLDGLFCFALFLCCFVSRYTLFVCLFYCFTVSRYSSHKVHTQTHTDTHKQFVCFLYCFTAHAKAA